MFVFRRGADLAAPRPNDHVDVGVGGLSRYVRVVDSHAVKSGLPRSAHPAKWSCEVERPARAAVVPGIAWSTVRRTGELVSPVMPVIIWLPCEVWP